MNDKGTANPSEVGQAEIQQAEGESQGRIVIIHHGDGGKAIHHGDGGKIIHHGDGGKKDV